MRLNPDCIRDILLTVEANSSFGKEVSYNPGVDSYPQLSEYTSEEIFYHIQQCELSGLLIGVSWCMGPNCYIRDLSPSAHQFLADIRSDTNWNKTKDIAKRVGTSSLSAIKEIAASVISDLIKSQFPGP